MLPVEVLLVTWVMFAMGAFLVQAAADLWGVALSGMDTARVFVLGTLLMLGGMNFASPYELEGVWHLTLIIGPPMGIGASAAWMLSDVFKAAATDGAGRRFAVVAVVAFGLVVAAAPAVIIAYGLAIVLGTERGIVVPWAMISAGVVLAVSGWLPLIGLLEDRADCRVETNDPANC